MKSSIDLVMSCPYRASGAMRTVSAGGARPVDVSALGIQAAPLSPAEATRLRDAEERVRWAFFTLWASDSEDERMLRMATRGSAEQSASLASASTWTARITASVIFLLDGETERSVAEASAVINSAELSRAMLEALGADDSGFPSERIARIYFETMARTVPPEVLMRMAPEESDRECLRSIIIDEAREKVSTMLSTFDSDGDTDPASRLGKIADLEISVRRALHQLGQLGDGSGLAERVADSMADTLEAYLSLELTAKEREKGVHPARAALRLVDDPVRKTRLNAIIASAQTSAELHLPAEALPPLTALQKNLNIIESESTDSETREKLIAGSVQLFARLKEKGMMNHPEVKSLADRFISAASRSPHHAGVASILSGKETLLTDREWFGRCETREDYEEFERLYPLSPLCVEARRLASACRKNPTPESTEEEKEKPSRSAASRGRYAIIILLAAIALILAAILIFTAL